MLVSLLSSTNECKQTVIERSGFGNHRDSFSIWERRLCGRQGVMEDVNKSDARCVDLFTPEWSLSTAKQSDNQSNGATVETTFEELRIAEWWPEVL